jgi:putative ABC transport system ATP-binding protein
VVVPVTASAWMMLQRNLLYTAVTRARKLVVLVGSTSALGRALRATGSGRRHTGLAHRLHRGGRPRPGAARSCRRPAAATTCAARSTPEATTPPPDTCVSAQMSLLHCLAGLDTLTSGDVRLGERSLTGLSDKELTLLRRDRMGFVFQAFNLLPTLTAAENIRLPLDLAGGDVDEAWFATVVSAVGLADRLDHTPAQLSGGQQQRVAAARALVTRPEIVFADEPTGALDSRSGAALLTFLRRAVDEFGQTIVMVTHDPVAAAHADRVVFLADGRIVDELTGPTVEAVLDRMKRLGN